jgi:5-methylcytosine-specific restriction endonuclease McrA
MSQKTCTKCNLTKPYSDFYKKKAKTRDGYRPSCKECDKAATQAWYAANSERARAYARENNWKWRAANPEKKYAQNRAWYLANIEKSRASTSKWAKANPDKIKARYLRTYDKEKSRLMANAWRAANPGRANIISSRWRAQNPEKMRECQQNWLNRHPGIQRVWGAARRARVLQAEGSHSTRDIKRLFSLQRGHCAACRKSIKPGYEIDHIIALARGGSNYPSNLQLLCPKCNAQKHAKDPIDFMQSRGYLL